MQKIIPLTISGIALLCLFILSSFYGNKYFIYNSTESLPEGFYRIIKKQNYHRGDLVVFPIPDSVLQVVTDRHWLPKDGLLIKNIVGVSGDSFSISGGKYVVRGELFGEILKADSQGRMMPVFSDDGVISHGFLVARRGVKTSFDSRYFGPVSADKIIGVAEPIFLFNR